MSKLRAKPLGLLAAIFITWILASGQSEPYHVGQTIKLAENLNLTVVTVGRDGFPKVNLTGAGEVFELQFSGPSVAIEPWKDPARDRLQGRLGP